MFNLETGNPAASRHSKLNPIDLLGNLSQT